MDPYLYSAGMCGEGFMIDGVQDLNEYAYAGKVNKLARKPDKAMLTWIKRILAHRNDSEHTAY